MSLVRSLVPPLVTSLLTSLVATLATFRQISNHLSCRASHHDSVTSPITSCLATPSRLSLRCCAVPLSCCDCGLAPLNAPLRRCAVTPSRCCTVALLRRCAAAPLRRCGLALLRAPLRRCPFAPLRCYAFAPVGCCAVATTWVDGKDEAGDSACSPKGELRLCGVVFVFLAHRMTGRRHPKDFPAG